MRLTCDCPAGVPPMIRVDGDMKRIQHAPRLAHQISWHSMVLLTIN